MSVNKAVTKLWRPWFLLCHAITDVTDFFRVINAVLGPANIATTFKEQNNLKLSINSLMLAVLHVAHDICI